MYSLEYTSEEINAGFCTPQDLFQLFIGYMDPSGPSQQTGTSTLPSHMRSKKKIKKLNILELNNSQPSSSSSYVSRSLQRSLGKTVTGNELPSSESVKMVENETSLFHFPLVEVVEEEQQNNRRMDIIANEHNMNDGNNKNDEFDEINHIEPATGTNVVPPQVLEVTEALEVPMQYLKNLKN